MKAYIYQAALLCESCGELVKATTECPGDPADEYTFDSDQYPKGPFPDGGEAPAPAHCNHCGTFLENPLTDDGYEYAREACEESLGPVTEQWAEYYEFGLARLTEKC